MSASTGSSELVRAMGPVARELLGDPTEENKAKRQLRFGNRGSMSVDLGKGTWHDHEAGKGGGVLALVQEQRSLDKEEAIAWLRERGHLPKANPSKGASKRRQIAAYDYTTVDGCLVFQVVRFEPKDFRQRQPNGNGGWLWKMAGAQRLIYRLPKVVEGIQAGATIYVVEGEKAADRLAELDLIATCSPAGANKWKADHSAFLVGADVVILPDNDEPGRSHAAMVAASLQGKAASIRVLTLPGLPDKGDIADWITSGGTRKALEALLVQAQTAPDHESAPTTAPRSDDTEAAIAAVVERFNGLYLVVNEAGKAVIFQPGFDPVLKRRRFDRLSLRDLQTLYLNERIKVGEDDDRRPIFKTAADLWLRHPDRRQFIHGVTFDPTGSDNRPGVLNLWEGFAVKPCPGDWSLMRDHIRVHICADDPVRFTYLMGWMARLVQHPAEQGEVAVVMRGGEGTGKGTLARALRHIIGHHALAISNAKHLVGNFNAHLRDTVFLFADEAFFAGDRAHVGVLKSIITEPCLTIEAKFQNAIETPNFLHLMMASNEEWVVPAALDARRFLVLEVSDGVKNNHEYFAAIWQQMEAGGYAAMLHDLLAYDLSCFNVRAVPTTAGLQHQQKLSLPTTESWWQDCLARGYVFKSKLGLEEHFGEWAEAVSTEMLFSSYTEFAERRHERHPLSRETLGRFMRKMGAHPKRLGPASVGEHLTDEPTPFGGTHRVARIVNHPRPPGYSLGSLPLAREAFAESTGLAIEWGEPEESLP